MNLIVNLVCERRHLEDFEYHYSMRHWDKRRSSRNHLMTLVLDDGWGDYSSVQMSLINRSIDSLVALHSFNDLIPEEKYLLSIKAALASFSPRYISLKRIEISFWALKVLDRALLAYSRLSSSTGNSNTVSTGGLRSRLDIGLTRLGILIEFSRVRDVQDVYVVLLSRIDLTLIPKLRQRVLYWENVLVDAHNLN